MSLQDQTPLLTNAETTLSNAKETAKHFRKVQYVFAGYLELIHRFEYWRPTYATFKEYLKEELDISQRTAQEMLKVYRVCQAHSIPEQTVAELGWSKMAVVANSIHAGNVEAILEDIKQKKLSEIKQEYFQQGKTPPPKKRSQIVATEVIHNAISLASKITGSSDIQVNMEFIAENFIDRKPRTARFYPHWN